MNLTGSVVLHLALEQVASDYRGDTYGGLALHVLKVTTFDKTARLITNTLPLVDDKVIDLALEFGKKIEIECANPEFWRANIDEMVQTAGLTAHHFWKNNGFETNKDEFRKLQNFLFDSVLFNIIIGLHRSKEKQNFIKQSIGQSIFKKLFG
jgi:hypothetical protein